MLYNHLAMKNEAYFDTAVWEEFQKEARKRRLSPARMLTDYMRECLDGWEFEKLLKEMQRDARRSGYTEEDAVELVRQHRLEKQQLEKKRPRAAS